MNSRREMRRKAQGGVAKIHFKPVKILCQKYKCSFCGKTFAQHEMRMKQHILKFCLKVPDVIKEAVRSVNKKKAVNLKSRRIEEPKMDINERDKLWELLSRAIYVSGTPLSIVENEYWSKFFAALRPDFVLPSRKLVSTTLLDAEFKRVESKVEAAVTKAKSYGVQVDAWSNIRYEPIVNVMVTIPEPLLLKSIYSETEHHTGEYFARIIKDVIISNGKERCLSVCTDNASTMQKSWRLLAQDPELEELPIAYHGCGGHTGNLLVTDIIQQPTSVKIKANVSRVVNVVNGSQILKEQLKVFQKEVYECALALLQPIKTRWCYIVPSIKSVLRSRVALVKLAQCPAVQEYLPEDVKLLILSESFWIEADQFCFLLEPLKVWIAYFESDVSCLSKTHEAMEEITKHFEANLPLSPLSEKEQAVVMLSLQERKAHLLSPIHLAANILDPMYQGQKLTRDQWAQGVEHVRKVAKAFQPSNAQTIRLELRDYLKHEGFWSKNDLWTIAKNTKQTSRVWWNSVCGSTALSKIASAILSMPVTSAATERSFSAFSHVHNKKRNRLTTERAAKIVYIARNLQTLCPGTISRNLSEEIEDIEDEDNYCAMSC